MKVLVVGAGIGGLCLAQGLRRAGIDVRVLERGAAPAAGGYRMRIDEHGMAALSRCLPPELVSLLRAAGNPDRPLRTTIFDHRLNPLAPPGERAAGADPSHASVVTNNRTLREVLLAGLADRVEFGRTVVAATDKGDGVVVDLAGGDVETADLVVAADGIDSTLRAAVAPAAELVDVGVRGIFGHAILDADLRTLLPDGLYGGASPIIGPDGLTMVVGVYQPVTSPQRAAAAIAPQVRLSHVPDHVRWALVGAPESFGVGADSLAGEPAAALRTLALGVVSSWSPALAEMVARTDDAAVSLVPIRAALTVPEWPVGRVTLLGDAIHATTAFGGSGACLALRDAALLTDALEAVARDGRDLPAAVASYEHQMRGYGAAAALRSRHGAERLFRVDVPALG